MCYKRPLFFTIYFSFHPIQQFLHFSLIFSLHIYITNSVHLILMNIRFNWFFKMACASMFAGVTLGARFGHQGQLSEEGAVLFSKAQLYNVTNSLGLIACSVIATPSLPLKIAAAGFVTGQLLFITPLFISSVKGKQPALSKVMPMGGGSMMIAWLALIFA